ncbi:hypothetical protein B0H16DRAFT_1623291 [Mycena metata]|uniref:Uncharacterized protein n=1 Tax=Mycena metata TaxID=1033252 RepID=A0AAD7H631_9AGAR|nr:hypothetical protein B0H16DRAFT_1623291 [Mycena metata]
MWYGLGIGWAVRVIFIFRRRISSLPPLYPSPPHFFSSPLTCTHHGRFRCYFLSIAADSSTASAGVRLHDAYISTGSTWCTRGYGVLSAGVGDGAGFRGRRGVWIYGVWVRGLSGNWVRAGGNALRDAAHLCPRFVCALIPFLLFTFLHPGAARALLCRCLDIDGVLSWTSGIPCGWRVALLLAPSPFFNYSFIPFLVLHAL